MKTKLYLLHNIQFKWIDLFYALTISVSIGLLFNMLAYTLMMLLSGIKLDINFFFCLFPMLTLLLLSTGASLILSIVRGYLHDIKHAWDLVCLMILWTSGVFFDGEKLLDAAPWAVYFQPFILLIINFRDATMYGLVPEVSNVILNLCQGLVIFIIGFWLFKKFATASLEGN